MHPMVGSQSLKFMGLVAYDPNAEEYNLGRGAVHRPCCENCQYSVRVIREPSVIPPKCTPDDKPKVKVAGNRVLPGQTVAKQSGGKRKKPNWLFKLPPPSACHL